MEHLAATQPPVKHIPGRPYLLVLSSPDKAGLLAHLDGLCDDLMEHGVELSAKAQGLAAGSFHDAHRAFAVTRDVDVDGDDFAVGVVPDAQGDAPPASICLLFTGQGAQWPQMGQQLLGMFPVAHQVLIELDEALQRLADPPSWSIVDELSDPRTVEQYGRPEMAQTLTTAVQLALVAIYRHWGVKFATVIGHSSGEIAAACAAGLLTRAEAIATAYYCGWAAMHGQGQQSLARVGMLAAAMPADAAEKLLRESDAHQVEIACYNGPQAITLAGPLTALESLQGVLSQQGRRTSLLNCPVAYHHSDLMEAAGQLYESKLRTILASHTKETSSVRMVSTVMANLVMTATDAAYWKRNLLSPVRFEETLTTALMGTDAPTILIEVGPAGSLAGAVTEIKAKIGPQAADIPYCKSMNRGGKSSTTPMFQTAGRLFLAGAEINIGLVNK